MWREVFECRVTASYCQCLKLSRVPRRLLLTDPEFKVENEAAILIDRVKRVCGRLKGVTGWYICCWGWITNTEGEVKEVDALGKTT